MMPRIHFRAVAQDFDLSFETDGIVTDESWIFKDESMEDTKITITFLKSGISLKRDGKINMHQSFFLGEKTEGHYQSDLGVSFAMEAYTKELVIKPSSISLVYDSYIDEILQTTIKIAIKIK